MKVALPPRIAFACLVTLVWSWAPPGVGAEDLLDPGTPIAEAVDHYIDKGLAEAGVEPAPITDDANLLRRTTLDLVGRIPTAAEASAYAQSSDPAKRGAMVQRLLEGPAFARHQRNEFDLLLMGPSRNNEWRDYLLKAFLENRSWDLIFREVMLGREDDPERKAAAFFIKDRAKDLNQLTNDASRLFFGVSINCAQCHDHPFVETWRQDLYFGMASFFNRTYLTKRKFLAEKDEGIVKFKTTAGEEKVARLMFLTGKVLEEPAPIEKTDAQKKAEAAAEKKRTEDKDAPPPPPPAFSRRTQLVDIALADGQSHYLARSIVNRVWARLFGWGLINPLDQMHSENYPEHPELIDWLERDLIAHGYDLRRLIRGLTLSKTYARSSAWPVDEERPDKDLFAVANVRPLSPYQYAYSLLIASGNPNKFAGKKPDETAKRLDELEKQSQGLAGQFEIPGEHFQVGVGEALLFSNSGRIADEMLRDQPHLLLGRLKEIDEPGELVKTLYWNVLTRAPTAEEAGSVNTYLAHRADRPVPARRQAFWALLTGTELRFNH